jgi:hypothetical protein
VQFIDGGISGERGGESMLPRARAKQKDTHPPMLVGR